VPAFGGPPGAAAAAIGNVACKARPVKGAGALAAPEDAPPRVRAPRGVLRGFPMTIYIEKAFTIVSRV